MKKAGVVCFIDVEVRPVRYKRCAEVFKKSSKLGMDVTNVVIPF